MPKKFIQNIQKLIDQTDQRRQLGILAEKDISNFKFTPKNLTTVPVKEQEKLPEQQNNLIWSKIKFFHNRGKFSDLLLTDFFTTRIIRRFTFKSSVNGNIFDYFKNNNVNVSYRTEVEINDIGNVALEIKSSAENSIAVYLRHVNDVNATIIFTSGDGSFVDGTIFLPFDKTGGWEITILYYYETGPSIFSIEGDFGSYVSSYDIPGSMVALPKAVQIDTTFGNQGFESVFIDGANGPAISNIVYWKRFSNNDIFGESLSGIPIEGYGFYQIVNEKFDFTVVSGWGTDAFVVAGDKLNDFPLAGTIGIPGPITTAYQISGTALEDSVNQTIITISGTNFLGSPSDSIYIERTKHLIDIYHDATDGTTISGTHFNVTAGNLYNYEIDTFDNLGNRGFRSARISGVAGDFIPPDLVTSLTATGGLKQIVLDWTNPSNNDIKGIHIWDKDNIISGTDKPIETLIKASNGTLPNRATVKHVTSGNLIDVWPYDLYVSTFDWAGNEQSHSMPTVVGTTTVEIKSSREGQRIELDTTTNQLRYFSSGGGSTIVVGEDAGDGLDDGIQLDSCVIKTTNINSSYEPIFSLLEMQTSSNLNNDAIRGEILHSFSTEDDFINSKSTAIHGIISDDVPESTNHDYISIWGENETLEENEHVFAGYFTGAKVFVEKDLIVSGTNITVGRIVNTTRITGNTTLNATHHNVFCDTDGGVLTVSLPVGVDGTYYRIINVGSSGNDLTISPDGSELLEGVNADKTVIDGSVIVLVYETTEGWW